MTPQLARRSVVALLVLLLIGGLWTVPVSARAQEPDPLVEASNHLYECIQTGHTLSVLFVMDTSGSLNSKHNPTDPQNIRYEGMRSALTGLATIARPDGRPLAVEAAVGVFSDTYRSIGQIVDWTQINTEDSSSRIDRMVRQTESRSPSSGGTNFEEALQGGLRDFQSRKQQGVCRIMLWFTDGMFTTARGEDLQDSADKAAAVAAVAAARHEMCSATSGVVDRIRRADIVLIGLQLGDQAGDLRRMSVGTFGGKTCGTYPVPDNAAPGGYLQADQADSLAWVFSRMGDLAQGCTPTGERGGTIDPGMHRMVVRAQRPSVLTALPASELMVLRAPDGKQLKVSAPGSAVVAGYALAAHHDSSQIAVTVTFPDGAGDGKWSVDPGFEVTDTSVAYCVFPDLTLSGPTKSGMPQAGKPSQLGTVIIDHNGEPAPLLVYRQVAARTTVVGGQGGTRPAETTVADDGHITAAFTPEATDARLSVQQRVTITSRSGLVLPVLALDFAVGVASADFPSVLPADQLDLGTAVHTEPTSADLTLIGAEAGPSEVCLEAARLQPEDAERYRFSQQTGCVPLAAGERRTVTVTVTPLESHNGRGTAELPLVLKAAVGSGQQGNQQSVTLPVVWRMDQPANQWVLFGILAAALVVSLGLVLLAVFLAKYFTAYYRADNLRWGETEVNITPNGPLRLEASGPVHALFEGEKLNHDRRRRFRRLRLQHAELRVKTSWWPHRASEFYAVPDKGYRISTSLGMSRDARWAPTTQDINDLVVLTVAEHQIPQSESNNAFALLALLITSEVPPSLDADTLGWESTLRQWREAVAEPRPSDTTDTSRQSPRTNKEWT